MPVLASVDLVHARSFGLLFDRDAGRQREAVRTARPNLTGGRGRTAGPIG